MEAGEAGADYVAFGSFYPTTTKDVKHRPEPVILSWWHALFELPSVAIGGITPENAAPLIAAVGGDPDLARAAWAYAHGMVGLELAGRFPPDADLAAAWRKAIAAFSG